MYGDSAHVHGVTAIGNNVYSASYDSAGDMTCRTINASVHCPLAPLAQPMSYDNERRMTHWQNKPVDQTATDDFLYDGSGQRVEQQSVVSGTTSDTAYLLGGVEEVTAGVVTKYLGVSGLPTAIRVGTSGSLDYLATDGLGSVSEALDGSGNVVAAQLYTPYGQTRYSSGTMPTSKGFTGQRADAVSGLDYYGARYYDPVAGQFTAADAANDGLSRYAYVRGNPETMTDPTGKRFCNPSKPSECGGPPPKGKKYDCHEYNDCGPTTEQIKNGQKKAAQDASNAESFFSSLATGFFALALVFTIIAAAIAVNIENPLDEIYAGVFAGLAAAAFTLQAEANDLAEVFKDQASHSQDLEWYTMAHLSAANSQVAGIKGKYYKVLTFVTGGSLLAGFARLGMGLDKETSDYSPNGGAFMIGAAMSYLYGTFIGTETLTGLADYDISQEEQSVWT